MRLFVATYLSGPVRAACDRYARALATGTGGVLRPIPPHSAHLTVAFLGEVDPDGLDQVAGAVRDGAAGYRRIEISFEAPVVLMAGRVPRLISASVEDGRDQWQELARGVLRALASCAALGPVGEPKPPHVTLARFRRDATRADAARLAPMLSSGAPTIARDDLSRVDLVRSHLGPDGPRYESVVTIDLA
jgi:2'-5' RNA ligase